MLSKEELYKYYWIKGMTLKQIGELCNRDKVSVLNWMKKYDIPTRPAAYTHQTFVAKMKKLSNCEYELLDHYEGDKTKTKFLHTVCGTEFNTTPSEFINSNRRCPKCTKEQMRLRMTKSHDQFVDEVRELVEEEYTVEGEYVDSVTKIGFQHMECGSYFDMRPSAFLKGQRCPECFGTRKKTIEEFIDAVASVDLNGEYIVLGDYVRNDMPIKMYHTVCGNEIFPRPSDFLLSGNRCIYCSGHAQKDTDKFMDDVFKIVENEYSVLGEYVNSDTKITMRHEVCGHIFDVVPNNFLRGSRCPRCNQSKGEKRIESFLSNSGIRFEPQYRIAECKNKRPLPFDFAIFDDYQGLVCLIEFDGMQHFKLTRRRNAEDLLRRVQKHDQIKNKYCADNNIKLIRIPYTDFDRIEEILASELSEIIDHDLMSTAI
jgi:predicted  nucleic acid-binding Zn-ribbon protein